MLYKVVLTFESVDEVLNCQSCVEHYFPEAVLSVLMIIVSSFLPIKS